MKYLNINLCQSFNPEIHNDTILHIHYLLQ